MSVNQELSKTLLTQDIGVLAQAALKAPYPTNPREWLYRLALLTRADYRGETLEFLNARPHFLDSKMEWALSGAVDDASRYENIPLAKRLSELFPEIGRVSPWFEQWRKTVSVTEADQWLAKQGHQADEVWFDQRLSLRESLGTERELLAPLEKAVRKHPDDEEALLQYLRAVGILKKPQQMGWLTEVLKPGLAAQSYVLASWFPFPREIRQALYERSLAQPFTPKDIAWFTEYERKYPMAYPVFSKGNQLTQKQLRDWTKSALLPIYKDTNQIQKAQRLLEELIKENPNGYVGGEMAGQIQGASGARVVETKIRNDEAENKESAEYWLNRAQYYSGRKENAQAAESFEKALALAPMPEADKPSLRVEVVRAYARHLWLQDITKPKKAYDFLHAQLAISPKQGNLADVIVSEMLHCAENRYEYIVYDDPVLWAHLEALPEWHYHGASLLRRLIEVTPVEKRQVQWTRAEKMLQGDAIPQRYILAQVLVYIQEWNEAVRVHRDLLERTQDKEQRMDAMHSLWAVYQRTQDFAGMQRLFPEMLAGGQWKDSPATAFFDLAIAAGQSGNKAEALRFFQAWNNQDRRATPQFYPLPSLGIENEIRSFYRQLEQNEPQCDAPRRVWKLMGS